MTKLTRDLIIAKARGQSLPDLKQLNICGLHLTDISIIEELHALEVLVLSVNDIKTLKHFVHCSNLRELYLRKNSINDLKELRYLKKFKNLRIISLIDNPCIVQAGLNYRIKVLRILPNLNKLDDVVISEQERQSALSFGCDDDSEEENDARFVNQGPTSPRPRTGLSRQSSNLEGSQEISTGHGDFEPSLKKKNSFTINPLVEEKLECEYKLENYRPKVNAVKSMTAREMSITNEEQNEPWKKNFKPPNYSLPNIGNTYNETKNYMEKPIEKPKFRIVKTEGSNFDTKLDGKSHQDFAPDGRETSQALIQSLNLVDIMDYESLQKMRQAVFEMMEARGGRE